MTRIEFWEPSPEDEISGKGIARTQFMPHTFDSVIGQRVPFRARPGGEQIGWATVIEVRVDGDGFGATWVVDADLGSQAPEIQARHSGFAFRVPPDDPVVLRDPLAARPLVISRKKRTGGTLWN